MNDRELELLARGLGREEARGVDPAVTAERVLARLREAPSGDVPVWWRAPLLRVAALMALILGSGVVVTQLIQPRGGEETALIAVPPELDRLEAGELAEVLEFVTLDTPVEEFASLSLDDLDEGQLRRLLVDLES